MAQLRRRILLFTLALATPATFFAYKNAMNAAAANSLDIAAALCMALLTPILMLCAVVARRAAYAIGAIFILGVISSFVLRLASSFLGADATLPLAQITPPYVSWLPLVFVLSFVLLQTRLALWLSAGFYVATCAIVLAYALTRSSEPSWSVPLVALLQQFIIGHAIYIGLLAMVPILQRRYAQTLEQIKTLRHDTKIEQRLAAIVTATQDAIIVTDLDGNITAWNPAAEALYGYRADEIIGRSALCLIPPPLRSEFNDSLQRSADGEASEYTETHRLAKDGTLIDVNVATVPIKNAQGETIGRAATTHDLRAAKRARRALAESEERFRGTFVNAPIGLALVSLEGRWLEVNAALCDIVGYSADELLQTDFQTITHPDDLESDLELLGQLLAGEIESYRLDKRYFHKDGSTVFIVLAVSLIRDENNTPLYFVSQIEDVTEERRIQAQLLERSQELERSNEELESYAHVVSHDLREPLRGIGGFVGLLEKHLGNSMDDTAREYMHFIQTGATRGEQLIADLLEYARLGNKREMQTLDVDAVLAEVLQSLQPQIMDTGTQVDASPMPQVRANALDLQRLLQNLIGNAIKFSALHNQVSGAPQVSVSGIRQGAFVRIEICDNGPGVADSFKDDVFRIFRRLHGREVSGTGIGLAICRKLVQNAGGDIGVTDAPNQGACFFFTLPAA